MYINKQVQQYWYFRLSCWSEYFHSGLQCGRSSWRIVFSHSKPPCCFLIMTLIKPCWEKSHWMLSHLRGHYLKASWQDTITATQLHCTPWATQYNLPWQRLIVKQIHTKWQTGTQTLSSTLLSSLRRWCVWHLRQSSLGMYRNGRLTYTGMLANKYPYIQQQLVMLCFMQHYVTNHVSWLTQFLRTAVS